MLTLKSNILFKHFSLTSQIEEMKKEIANFIKSEAK